MKITDSIPKSVKKMILRAAAGTVTGELLRKALERRPAEKGSKAAESMNRTRKAAAAVTDANFPKKPGRVKLQSIHGSKKSAIDRLVDLGLSSAITEPIKRMQQRKRRRDLAGTAAVALTKVVMRVKWR